MQVRGRRPAVALTLVAVAFSMGAVIPSPTAWAASPLALKVSGNQLVNSTGARVQLRGANVSGTEFACVQGGTPTRRGYSIYGDQPLDRDSTFAAMAAWHINVVRIPLNEDCWLGINGVSSAYGGAKYRAAIQTEVRHIHQARMYAILDLHWTSPGRYAALDQQEMADVDHSIAFWSSVAGAYKHDHAVIFDLYNEPYFYWIADGTNEWSCWLKGCEQGKFVSNYQKLPNGRTTQFLTAYRWRSAGMNQLIAAVRRAGATNPVLANGVGWGSDDTGWLAHQPTDPIKQLVAGFHDYPGQCDPTRCIPATVVPIAKKAPVLVGETGDNVTAPVTWVNHLLPALDADRIGYLGWTWNPWAGYPNDVLITDWRGTPTTNFGQYFRHHLVQVAARP